MVVSVDLMNQGFAVYRALSPSAPFDIVAIKGEVVRKIEVRSGWYTPTGQVGFSLRCADETTEFAVYTDADKKIHYMVADDVRKAYGRSSLA